MTDRFNIVQAVEHSEVFLPFFKDISSWANWLVVLRAIFGLPIESEQDQETFRKLTNRSKPPTDQAEEVWITAGRRSGKSFILAVIAVFLACFRKYDDVLSKGERGCIVVIAADRRQSRIIFNYSYSLIKSVGMLNEMIKRETADIIELNNGISIEIHTASFRAVRGYTVVAALCDEVAFWWSDRSSNPDTEIIAALQPAMATVPGAILFGISSPFRMVGSLYEAFRDHYGKDDDPVLVIKAKTHDLNPTIPQKVIDRAYQKDPVKAATEWGAEFRQDVQSLLVPEWVDQCVNPDRPIEIPYNRKFKYHGFVDSSGGQRDAFTLAISHTEDDATIVDLCRGVWPPFSPDKVVKDYCELLKAYKIGQIKGDKYGSEWVVERFRKHKIQLEGAGKPKSVIYTEAAPEFAILNVDMPRLLELEIQLKRLQRKTGTQGRDVIDHPPGGYDDFANACCGAIWLASSVKTASDWRASSAMLNTVHTAPEGDGLVYQFSDEY